MSQLPLLDEDSSSPPKAALVWTAAAFGAGAALIGLWFLARWIVGC